MLVATAAMLLGQDQTVEYKPGLALHVYRPPDWKTNQKRTGIVFFFGGGWVNGTVKQFEPHAKHFAAKGLVVSRQRSGAIVRPRNEWHLLDPDVLCWLIATKPQREFQATLMDVRRVFEPAAAALAALPPRPLESGSPFLIVSLTP